VVPVSASAYEYAGGLAITQDGSLYEWFGVPAAPVQVAFPPEVTEVKAVSRRFSHNLALTDDGLYAWGGNSKGQLGLYAWGNNSAGQLGISGFSYKLTPAKVNGEDNAFDIATAEYSSVALH
jgi:alpha-tubulin suppressor-like RCC1 family protein